MEWTATLPADLALKTEWYRLEKRDQHTYIKWLCQRIAEAFRPEKIILFGSRAYGNPQEDSDIDLLIIMPYAGSHRAEAVRIRNHLGVLAPMDILVRTPDEVRERIEMGDQFMREIVARGKVIYEANHTGVDRQSGRRLARRA